MLQQLLKCMRACVCACVRACVCACVRVCVRACVRACVNVHCTLSKQQCINIFYYGWVLDGSSV